MDKKRKDAVIRATVDRAALLRGVLMLTALALLLCFGLKPSRAAALKIFCCVSLLIFRSAALPPRTMLTVLGEMPISCAICLIVTMA